MRRWRNFLGPNRECALIEFENQGRENEETKNETEQDNEKKSLNNEIIIGWDMMRTP